MTSKVFISVSISTAFFSSPTRGLSLPIRASRSVAGRIWTRFSGLKCHRMNHRQRTLKDKLVDSMTGVVASMEQLDQCGHVLPSDHQPCNKLVEACACMCIAPAIKLEAWNMQAGEAWPRARLEDICAKQGFSIFHLIMSY